MGILPHLTVFRVVLGGVRAAEITSSVKALSKALAAAEV